MLFSKKKYFSFAFVEITGLKMSKSLELERRQQNLKSKQIAGYYFINLRNINTQKYV